MEKRKSVMKMNPLTDYYFKKTREEKKEDRNERDKEEEEDEEDGALNEVDEPGPLERKGEGDAGGSRGTVAVKLYKYNPQWENVFKWLIFKEGKMLCKWCLAHPKLAGKNAFVTGDAQLKRDTVKKHAMSRKHEQCRDAFISCQNKVIEKAVGRQQASSDEETIKQLKMKFNIAYYVAKEEIAFTKFPKLFALHKKNGVDINPTYNNDKRCAEMIGQIADVMREELREKIESAHYLAVLIDGDTDVSNTECEIVYIRLVEAGKPVNILVGQQALGHAHALGVLNATKAAFAAVCEGDGESWMKKLVSFGADGASVNMGRQGGVVAHLQHEAGLYIIPIHCMPHRLELAILTLQKKEPKVAIVYDLLHLIWKTYHYSGKSKRELYALGQELGVDVHNPSSVKGTRWIPHIRRALKVFLHHGEGKDLASDPDQYSVVFQHMEHLTASQSCSVEVQGRAKKGMTLKGSVDGLTHPGLARHVDAAVQICLDAINTRFGSLVSDDGARTPLDSFKALNPDAWPKDQASLLTFGNDSIAELATRFEKPLRGAGCDIPSIMEEWQSLKMLISENFPDKSYTDLWELLLTKDPYKTD
ncbi:zinc finger protein 862-like isoform X2 [Sparus aurata]|uniref:zinc finger protein 862-like isoform X2 n=1 Tax=Sparus aurata TaxID=8175 RepID=UPI0011C1590E|nr:zinc finger protein 862-like isoform X2 [Sparus aurata]